MDLAYQQIWDADQSQNGLPALRTGEAKDEDQGFVVVDERATGVGTEHKVIKEVLIPNSKRATYDLCQKLFDNYALLRATGEFIKPDELQEEFDFINNILPTKPIQVAKAIMEQRLGLTITDDLLAAMIRETWFKFGTSGNQDDASGFEHVFVGEQSSKSTKLGGYHYWHKFFIDDGGSGNEDRLEYHGTRYQGAQNPGQGILVPEVVTLSLTVDLGHGDDSSSGPSGSSKKLNKPIGGFFVGCSPEGLIALGLVRCRTPSDKVAKINGSEYQLDLHRLDNEPNSIRTFFPRFRRSDVIAIEDDVTTDQEDIVDNEIAESSSNFRMVAAMVNPFNPEGGREFVQILNVSNQDANLAGWKLRAPNGKTFTFSNAIVSPGDTFKFVLPVSQGVLRNKEGQIRLLSTDGSVAHAVTYSSEQAAREGSPVVFLGANDAVNAATA